jgi:hypothetical protein
MSGRAPMDLRPDGEASAPSRQFLRHCVATLAYRAAKALRGAPEGFAGFELPGAARRPSEILAHMVDLLDWALSLARGKEAWVNSKPGPWDQDTARFFRALEAFDAYLASDAPLHAPPERLFQGPVADALTHVGQIATRRRLAGAPVRGENYYRADIAAGRVGSDQLPPRREFD